MNKQKQELNISQQYLNDLNTDFRFEVITVALTDHQIDCFLDVK